MVSMDRQEANRLVYRRLIEPAFRERLTAVDADGNHPILVVLPSDSVDNLLTQLGSVGGAANVVTPFLNGLVALTMHAANNPLATPVDLPRLRRDCTVGVLLAQVLQDLPDRQGAVGYQFVVAGHDSTDSLARAELAALAG